jgi:hypothetical protein
MPVSSVKISKHELKNLIEIGYSGDKELLEKYHVQKFEFSQAVNSTMGMIDQQSSMCDLKYFKIVYNKKPIGYFITGFNNLFSFAINIKYRKKDILVEWWQTVKKELGEYFDCNLFLNNTRAIKFLQKQGMKIFGIKREHNFVKLLNK